MGPDRPGVPRGPGGRAPATAVCARPPQPAEGARAETRVLAAGYNTHPRQDPPPPDLPFPPGVGVRDRGGGAARHAVAAQHHAAGRHQDGHRRRNQRQPAAHVDLLKSGPSKSGEGGAYPVVQAAPLSVKAVGAGLVPVCEPLNPIPTDVPGLSTRFQSRFTADTSALPEGCAQVADQPWVRR